MNLHRTLVIIICVLFINVNFSFSVLACKDIIACGDATSGEYNLLLKVRDPSRNGLQVLSIVPEGYEYTYHHPWTGLPINFLVGHKSIAVATQGDVIPNIVKAGMSLTDAGLAFGDADSNSNWINPLKYAWDDFDWIRYASDVAGDESEAVFLLTNDVVDNLHATGVSENLFVVGPNSGYVVESDAFHYTIKEVKNGIAVMSNYPKDLWHTQKYKKQPIAKSFETVKEKIVSKGDLISLDSLFCLRVIEISDNSVIVRQIPFFRFVDKRFVRLGGKVEIDIGERATVGDFSVRLIEIEEGKARINLCNKFKAWEDELLENIQPSYGSIDIKNMINWSRLHRDDLDGLRGMCEKNFKYEAVAIYKIPCSNYQKLSSGWFSPNRACSSIYVPFHICNNDIFDPYETGEAAQVSLDLFNCFGSENLTIYFSRVEDVFLLESRIAENKCLNLLDNMSNLSSFLTFVDTSMQKQAFLTEQIWEIIGNISDNDTRVNVIDIISNIWNHSFNNSFFKMKNAKSDLEKIDDTEIIVIKIEEIMKSISQLIDLIY